ncbi:ABC transporter ATP-binding protein [Terrilactibacillus laevilacticus]|uniref:ABC transporter ATP-binding protein n=1 Tax=Terrilactibacillus laevilacticus TaxID=1380157 RepID=A0ABW5PP85_9BACI|nr:ABC transporter ATP-binding protein [Terrilactibacillus laevilacticus]
MLKLSKYLLPYKWSIVFTIMFVFLQSLANLYLPTLMSDIVDTGIVNGNIGYILKMGIYMLLITLVAGAFTIIANYLSAQVASRFGRDIRYRMFSHIESFSLSEFDDLGTASLITRSTNDISQVEQVFLMILKLMIMAPLMCIGGIIMAFYSDAKLSLVLVMAIPVIVVTILLIARRGIPLFKQIQKKMDRLNLVLREGLTGIRVVRSFNRVDDELKRFDQANQDMTITSVKVQKIMAAMMPMMMLIMNVSTIAIVWFGGLRISHGAMQVGDLMAFIQYAMQIMFSLMMGAMLFIMIPRGQASSVRINEVLATKPDITDVLAKKTQNVSDIPNRGAIEFKHVTFRYEGAENPAVIDLNFTANPGETTAIIGGTGAGKSTIMNLIPRFYDIEDGEILVDGYNIATMKIESLRQMIGYVPQKSVLFTGTVKDNIRYGKEDATDDEIKQAAKMAEADSFIQDMKDGYDSLLAQGGKNVSGGQKQRLSIARAIVKRPLIYLFDDSFSALDYKTDAKLRKALKSITATSTTIIVAQRISTVIDADKIIVLDEGTIAGIGTHESLMDTCQVYREIVSSQVDKEELA